MKSAQEYQDFLNHIITVLNQNDPIGLISMGSPLDEYMPEMNRIAPLVEPRMTVEELSKRVRNVFEEMFTPAMGDSVDEEIYFKIAKDILHFFKK